TPPQQGALAPAPAQPVDFGEPPVPAGTPGAGAAFAILHVPRFGADYQRPILQGTSLDLLARGVGHYPSSALPGEVGNFALAGHRVTYGRPFHDIAELRQGDQIIVETADAWYVYRMRSNLVVTPNRVDVVDPVPEEPDAEPTERLLTMTACHPMYSARERFVVHAVLDHWQPKSAGPPAELAASAGSVQAG
ncbi:MAG: class E sortase, partial [Actinomycetes bacterium]